MKYLHCKDPYIKAKVALLALKGEEISYLSAKYHVNREEVVIWRERLREEIHLERWMVVLFSKEPYFLEEKKEGSSDVELF